MELRAKSLLVELQGPPNKEVLERLGRLGVEGVVLKEGVSEAKQLGLHCYAPSEDADVILFNDLEELEAWKGKGTQLALRLAIKSGAHVSKAVEAAKKGVKTILVEVEDWKIIPLENLVAELQNTGSRLFAYATEAKEVPTLFGVLERGVDGVVMSTSDVNEVERVLSLLKGLTRIDLKIAEITEVKEVGMGERACIDTASILSLGEGMLVGSKSNFLFLIHNESIGSEFTSPRPFRVNAGAIHSYILLPDGRTKYLSELECGDGVLIANSSGIIRDAVVGRVKIERRPLTLVKAKVGEEEGAILVQNAETIRFVNKEGDTIPVTHLRKGDQVLVQVGPGKGRHFGIEVDEFILEK